MKNEKQFFVLVIEEKEGFKVAETWGPFKTVLACERRIKEDAVKNYTSEAGDFEEGELEDWGNRHIILESVKTVKPVPRLSLGVRLEEVKA